MKLEQIDGLIRGMGRLLDKLISGTSACVVTRERDGFTLVGKPDRLEEFSDLVREASENAGDEFVVFPITDGGQRYSQMFVLPIERPISP